MDCPVCKNEKLHVVLTRQGVEVDACHHCNGVWLDKGEIYYFSKNVSKIHQEITTKYPKAHQGKKLSPKNKQPMIEFALESSGISIDYCLESNGIWLDGGEIEKLNDAYKGKWGLKLDRSVQNFEETTPVNSGLLSLPNLFIRSTSVLVGLYALLTLLLIVTAEATNIIAPSSVLFLAIVIALIQFAASPFILDFSLRFMFRMKWVEPDQQPAYLRNFIKNICTKHGIKVPYLGIIEDGAPNAFTYGHTPNNARVVISQGLLDLLEPKEVEAVVAHEIGHAKHWDMALMTIAQLVPLLLYYIYRYLISIKIKGKDETATARLLIAIGAYILYIISEYLVLWFSRIREYHADRFAGNETKNPNLLTTALIKIAYGLAGQEKEGSANERKTGFDAVSAMGIFDSGAAQALAITSYSSGQDYNADDSSLLNKKMAIEAMKWDLWNPWARYYELSSTHPLTANRIQYLSNQAASMGLTPYIMFNLKKPESYWDEFLVDLLVYLGPNIALILCILGAIFTNSQALFGIAIASFGVLSLLAMRFSYNSELFPRMNIESLLRKVKVSGIRPVPCTLKGTIIGKGVPGLLWSEDFVIKDKTGIMFLDYRQPWRIWEFFFGLLRGESLQNKEVVLQGWYRRSPMPFVELKSFTVDGKTRTSYVYHIKMATSIIAIVFGIYFVLTSLILD
ncbi:hypothetical protein TI05_04670 [Achromatium sp. WMS3]|nr:hypothetical protein TI05_04670 [Achromatium sp. WMS3]